MNFNNIEMTSFVFDSLVQNEFGQIKHRLYMETELFYKGENTVTVHFSSSFQYEAIPLR